MALAKKDEEKQMESTPEKEAVAPKSKKKEPLSGKFVTDKPGVRLVDPDRPGVVYTNRVPVEVLEVVEGSWLDSQIEVGLIRKY